VAHAIAHALEGRPELVRDPLSDLPLSFEEPDLAAAVAQLLADGGYLACAIAPAPADAQSVGSEEEALVLTRLLVAELGLQRAQAAASASAN
jgi:hypothetical protein